MFDFPGAIEPQAWGIDLLAVSCKDGNRYGVYLNKEEGVVVEKQQ